MTVQDCLNEYERVGHEIFGKPRLISQRNIAIVNWPKYSAKAMEKVFQEVTMRRSEKHQQLNVLFPSMPGVCKTYVPLLPTAKVPPLY
jgi:hypothetical protein